MKLNLVPLLLPTLLLAGCKTVNWQPIDGASGDTAAIAEARKICRVDAKLALKWMLILM